MADPLGPAVEVWAGGDRVALRHRLTGRIAWLAQQTLADLRAQPERPELAPLRARLARLYMLEGAEAPLLELVPGRSRRVLRIGSILWHPVPAVHTSGGRGYAERALSDAELRLWEACNGARSLRAAADKAGTSAREAVGFAHALTAPDLQVLQLGERPFRARDPALLQLLGAARPPAHRSADQADRSGGTALAHYHLTDITDGSSHFDDRETTVAHTLQDPHPALAGQRYGARLRWALERRKIPACGLIVEVGCGDGALAAAFLEEPLPASARYTRIDLSPELLRVQRQRVPQTWAVHADARRLPLRDGCVDLLVSNEVLADLPSALDSHPEVRARVEACHLTPLPSGARSNHGAWRFVEEIARVLAPGGAACVTEFGHPDRPPEEAVQLDHPEVSIHFGHLVAIAAAHGLDAELIRLDELLELAPDARQLARHSFHALRAWTSRAGERLPARAWTASTLSAHLGQAVEGLEWVPMRDEGPGPLITRFYALLLRRG